MSSDNRVDQVTADLRRFAVVRAWEKFHTPKNLAMALAGECGELLAELQWLTDEEAGRVMEDGDAAKRIRSEVADVGTYLLRLCDVLGIDILKAVEEKLVINERRYPADESRGRAVKYNRL